jgi:hypothetical protein
MPSANFFFMLRKEIRFWISACCQCVDTLTLTHLQQGKHNDVSVCLCELSLDPTSLNLVYLTIQCHAEDVFLLLLFLLFSFSFSPFSFTLFNLFLIFVFLLLFLPLLLLLLALQSLVKFSLLQNCPPLYSIPRLQSPVSRALFRSSSTDSSHLRLRFSHTPSAFPKNTTLSAWIQLLQS